jgi:hypothetical protein
MVVGSYCCSKPLTADLLRLVTSLHVRTAFWNGVSTDISFAGLGAECAFATTSSSSTSSNNT